MKNPVRVVLEFALAVAVASLPVLGAAAAPGAAKLLLKQGWAIQSSAYVHAGGAAISTAKFQPENWYPATVPSTVLAALVKDRVYANPYYGKNLRSIPGTSYPIGANFSNILMPPDSPFRVPWWYRTQFRLPDSYRGKTVWLNSEGINYRANIWLNGHRIADSRRAAGTFRLFEFDVTRAVVTGGTNVLAVEVFPPRPSSLALTFVDWNPAAPDKGMGLWHDVYLTASGPVAVRYLNVITHLDLPRVKTAHLSVSATLRNATGRKISGVLKGSIGGIHFSKTVSLAAKQSRVVRFLPKRFAQLNIKNPRLWWPWQYGGQPLYELRMRFVIGGQVSDSHSIRFGIRQVTSELTKQGYRLFRINGRRILIRGGAWTPDLMLRDNPARLEAELRYARDMNLNAIRLEGKLANEQFLEFCDRHGILVMAGWCCCAHWEKWKNWKPEDYRISAASLRDQIRRLRSHPSVFVWLNGSDNPPPPKVEKTYISILNKYHWPNPYLSSATGKKTTVTGATGVKMKGPYEYVPPSYWYQGPENRGAIGYNTEISPGPAPPPIASLRRMLPASHLWPIDDYWNYHAGGGVFKTINVFNEALNRRYGKAVDLVDYDRKAQMQAYETHRAMFEAFGRNKYVRATGVIQWMMNNAWPSLIWHLYDYYLRPGGSYFGVKKACEPIHIQYSYDDRTMVVVNSYYKDFWDLTASVKLYNLDLTEKFSRDVIVDAGADSATRVFVVPAVAGLSRTYFAKLSLKDRNGKVLSSNFYWLSTIPDRLAWNKTKWYYTPTKTYGDLTGLETLPDVAVDVTPQFETRGEEELAHVTVRNPTGHLAFGVHLRVLKGANGGEVLPIFWQDNYFSLLPGESRKLTVTFDKKLLGDAKPVIAVDGWNIKRRTN